MSCKHRSSADKYGGNIYSGRRHQKSRHIFVAVGHHHQCVKLMCHRHSLCRIGDQVAGDQRIFHSDMPHGNPVAYGDGRKYDRRSSCHGDSHLHCLYDLIQVHVSRNDLIIRADNSHQRAVHLFFRQSQRVEQRTVRGLLHPLGNCVTSHD